ncbi:hypothetical protein JCM10212_003072 [Sporobolomyces blumeae]
MTSLSISLTISAPSTLNGTDLASNPPAQEQLSFPLDTASPLAHLRSLEHQLGLARDSMNDKLTVWKDLLKDVEKDDKKKHKKKTKALDEPDDDDDDEGDE